ncbi:MAG TPA: DUF1802 family protein [Verrucomicrobiae bacterium]|nr:DUF1802 family protein [Verrucomicrobiae bacterium]
MTAVRALDFCQGNVYFISMRAAFKEWAVVVDALGRGEQILILRKGGISEGRGGFKMEHPRFFLFPTLFHQQRESVIPSAQARFDEIAPQFPPPEKVRLEFFAEVIFAERLLSLSDANALRGQHVWRDEVIAERFEWGREKAIFALGVKVFRLPQPIELPMSSSYGGCKSWIELEREIAAEGSRPVLDEQVFQEKLARLRMALSRSAQFSDTPSLHSP